MAHILVTGNPVDGLQFHGPFVSMEDAETFGDLFYEEWWVAPLEVPVDEEGFTYTDGVVAPGEAKKK